MDAAQPAIDLCPNCARPRMPGAQACACGFRYSLNPIEAPPERHGLARLRSPEFAHWIFVAYGLYFALIAWLYLSGMVFWRGWIIHPLVLCIPAFMAVELGAYIPRCRFLVRVAADVHLILGALAFLRAFPALSPTLFSGILPFFLLGLLDLAIPLFIVIYSIMLNRWARPAAVRTAPQTRSKPPAATGVQTCPQCRLTHIPGAEKCECGHVFEAHEMVAPATAHPLAPDTGFVFSFASVVCALYGLLFALVAFQLGFRHTLSLLSAGAFVLIEIAAFHRDWRGVVRVVALLHMILGTFFCYLIMVVLAKLGSPDNPMVGIGLFVILPAFVLLVVKLDE